MKERIINCLELIKKETNKRYKILSESGIDLTNYENLYIKAALNMIVFNLFLMNKKQKKSEDQIREEIEWWLYEDVEKKYRVNKKEYNVEKAEDFINFLLEK